MVVLASLAAATAVLVANPVFTALVAFSTWILVNLCGFAATGIGAKATVVAATQAAAVVSAVGVGVVASDPAILTAARQRAFEADTIRQLVADAAKNYISEMFEASEHCFAKSNYKVFYDSQEEPDMVCIIDMQKSVKELLRAWGNSNNQRQTVMDNFARQLVENAQPEFREPSHFLVRLWTSQLSSPHTNNKEFCSVLNEVIRRDQKGVALKHAVVLCRGINGHLTRSRSTQSGIDVADPSRSRSTAVNKTYRVCGMPVDAVTDFYQQRVGGKFRTRMFLATSFFRQQAMDIFMPRVQPGHVGVLFIVRIDADRKTSQACFIEGLTLTRDEFEFLYVPYSVFTVEAVQAPSEGSNYWLIELLAATDNKSEQEDLPLAPWS
jgi:hypothetical protein